MITSDLLPLGVSQEQEFGSATGRGTRLTLGALSCSRATVVACTMLYAGAICFAYAEYLNPAWGYFGMSYRPPGILQILFMFALLFPGSMLIPAKLERPSSIVLLMLYVMVYVPTIVVTLLLDTDVIRVYGAILVAFAVAFSCACVSGRSRTDVVPREPARPGQGFTLAIFLLWAALCSLLIVEYGSIMRFVGLSDIYAQRAEGASTGLLAGYIQTYFDKVLSPALIALGLVRSRWLLVLLGAAGCMIMFMINAQRTSFLIPFAMISCWLMLRSRNELFRSTAFLLVTLSALIVWTAKYYLGNAVITVVALLLTFRTLTLPGLTFSQYYDLFGRDGFTWWSHVRGLDLLVPAPMDYLVDPLWPGLGYMIGDRLYGNIEYNANANLFSGDGVAAGGVFGILVIGAAFSLWLVWLDRATRGWDRTFVILVLVPVALALTNAHLFTTLLSFGGLLWTLVFQFYKPRAARPSLAGGSRID